MLPDTVRQSLIILDFWEGQEIRSRGTQSKSHAILYIKLKKKTKNRALHEKWDDYKSKKTTDWIWE